MDENFDNLNWTGVTNIDIGKGIALFLLLALGIYTIYAILVFKQVKILNNTLQTNRASTINLIALLHLLFSLMLLIAVLGTVLF